MCEICGKEKKIKVKYRRKIPFPEARKKLKNPDQKYMIWEY